MWNWNQISNIKDKAVSLGSKMKDVAKDMLVIEEDPTQSQTPPIEQSRPVNRQPRQQKQPKIQLVRDNNQQDSQLLPVEGQSATKSEDSPSPETMIDLLNMDTTPTQPANIDQLNNKIRNLTQDLDMYIETINRLETEKSELVKLMQSENSKQDCQSHEEAISELQTINQQLLHEVKALQEQGKDQQVKTVDLLTDETQPPSEVYDLKQTNISLEQQVREQAIIIENTQQENQDLTNQMKAILQSTQVQIEQLTGQIQQFQENSNSKETTIHDLEAELLSATQKYENNVSELQNELSTLKSKLSSGNINAEELTSQLLHQKDEATQLHLRIEELNQQLERIQNSLTFEVDEKTQIIQNLNKKFSDLQENLQKHEQDAEINKLKHQEVITELESKLIQTEETNKTQELKIQEFISLVNKLEHELSENQQQQNILKAENDILINRLQHHEEQNQVTNKDRQELTSKLQHSNDSLEAQLKDTNQLKDKLQKYAEEFDAQNDELISLRDQKNNFEKRLAENESIIIQLQNEVKNTLTDQETFDRLNDIISQKDQNLKSLEEKITQYHQIESQLKHRIEQAQETIQQGLTQNGQQQQQIDNLQSEMVRVLEDSKSGQKSLSEQLERTNIELQEYRNQLQVSQSHIRNIELEKQALSDSLRDINDQLLEQTQYRKHQDEIVDQKNQIIFQLESEVMSLQEQLKQIAQQSLAKEDNQNSRIASLEKEIATKPSDEFISELQTTREQQKQQIVRLENDCAQQQQEFSRELGELRSVYDRLSEEFNNVTKQNQTLQEELERCLNDMEKKNQQLSELSQQRDLFEHQINQVEAHTEQVVERFRQELSDLVQTLDQQKLELAQKNEELAQQTRLVEQMRCTSESEISENTTIIIKLEQTINQLQGDLQAMKDQNSYMEKKLLDSTQLMGPMMDENEQLRSRVKDLQETLTLEANKSISSQAEFVTAKEEIDSLKQSLSDSVQERATLISNIHKTMETFTQEYIFHISSFIARLNESKLTGAPIQYDDEFNQVLKEYGKKKQIQPLLRSLAQKTQICLTLVSDSLVTEMKAQEKAFQSATKKNSENYQQMQETYARIQESLQKVQEQRDGLIKKEQTQTQEISNQQKRIADFIEKINYAQKQIELKDAKIKDLERQLSDAEKSRKELGDEIKLKVKDLDDIKSAIRAKQAELQAVILQQTNQQSETQRLQDQIKKYQSKEGEYEKLKKSIEDKQYEVEQLTQGMTNIQLVNDDLQLRIQFNEQSSNEELSNLRRELADCQSQLQELMKLKEKAILSESAVGEFKAQLKKKDETILRLQEEKKELKMEVNDQIQKIKSETTMNPNQIDRRVISKFLVNYFDTTTSFQTKLQILETLGCILQFAPEEMEKIGLHKYRLKQLEQNEKISSPKIQQQPQQQQQSAQAPDSSEKSFKDRFIGYLLDDD